MGPVGKIRVARATQQLDGIDETQTAAMALCAMRRYEDALLIVRFMLRRCLSQEMCVDHPAPFGYDGDG